MIVTPLQPGRVRLRMLRVFCSQVTGGVAGASCVTGMGATKAIRSFEETAALGGVWT